MISKDNHPTVFTEVCLLDDGRVSGQNLAMPWVDQLDGGMQERVLHMLVKDPVEVIMLAEHGPDEQWVVMGSLCKLSDAEDDVVQKKR